MRHFFLVMGCIAAMLACNSQLAEVKNVGPDKFQEGIFGTDAQLVDVRTPEEFADKHIHGAININFNGPDFEKQMNALDKNKPVYIYCLAGGRSKQAASWAAKNGFKEVYNLEFGINSWLAENKPVVSGSNTSAASTNTGMTYEEYLQRIKISGKLVLVDFNAVWCGPCKLLKPEVNKAIRKSKGAAVLLDIDVDKNSTLASKLNVRGIPLLLLYKDGREVWRSLGVVDEETITAKIREHSR
ncbi:MAG: thioredoxin domain-containing protein [Chitinophagales bacterium]|nr:thioredoxin domain-containing protein [Chitinophagales bacterium]MDW8419151.1 thioredoxin domain-containing protein [Chitinophagales bacterium]